MTIGSTQKPVRKLRLTISAKLIGLIALLLITSITLIVYQSTKMYVNNDKENIQGWNVETTETLAVQTRDIFANLTEKMRFVGTILLQDPSAVSVSPLVQDFFDSDKDFVGIFIHKTENGEWTRIGQVFSPEFIESGDVDGTRELTMLRLDKNFSIEKLVKGEPQITPLKIADGMSLIAVAIPLNSHYTGLAFIKPSKLAGVFGQNSRGASYLVDHQGDILSHTDASRVGDNFSQIPVVKEFLSSGKLQNMVPYTDPATGESRLASYRVVGFAGLGVVSELPEALAFQAAHKMSREATLFGLVILFIAFWAGYLYSGTLTRPITKLVEAAQRIAGGDFKINLKFRGHDEIAHLSNAFNEMAKGLEERDRVKDTFNKFHNKEIAEKLLSGEVKLGGERKEATVFFSDVRGFTAMSESMQPEEVVEMLNEYMTRMVSIIRSHHGIVDKYIGDAIMGLWGVPIGGDHDLYNALRACLQMREELAKLNTLRMSRGQNALKIGMGLNVGPVIAGNIGSVEKMEYTVIGDTVNLASRMESMTKEYGTDLLIPQNIYDRLKDRFIFEKCKSAKVKGKTNAIEIYKVKGYIDAAGNGIIIETPYSSYESEKSDKVVHEEPAQESSAPPAVTEPKYYFVEMFGEVMGPFTPSEFKTGIASGDFPKDSRFSSSKSGNFRNISDFGLMTIAVGENVQPVEIPPFVETPSIFPTHERYQAPQAAAVETALSFEPPVAESGQEVPAFVQVAIAEEVLTEPASKSVAPPPFRHRVDPTLDFKVGQKIEMNTEPLLFEETHIVTDVVTEIETEVVAEAAPAFGPPDSAPTFAPPSAPPFAPSDSGATFAPPSAPPPSAPPPSAPPPNAPPTSAPTSPVPAAASGDEIAPPAFPGADVVSETPIELPSLEEKPAA